MYPLIYGNSECVCKTAGSSKIPLLLLSNFHTVNLVRKISLLVFSQLLNDFQNFLTDLINYIIVVSLLRCNKLDFSICSPRSHAAVSDLVLEKKREGFPEGLLEGGTHEPINYGVDGRVGVGHAVGPRLDLVRNVVGPVVWIERLEEDEDLDGAPADGEEEDDYDHHL